MASCILHVGTHKTGTTAIQLALASENGWVERAGLSYPRACRYYAGHHHLPFELLDSPKYDPIQGDMVALLDEMAQNSDRTSVVSSEVLHFLAARPDALRALADGLANRGIDTRVVLFARERPSYVESLYAQLLKRGLTLSFDAFARAFEADGAFRFDAMRRFDLNYARIADAFAEAFGRENVIVRPYRSGAPTDAIVRDFLEAIGVPPARVAHLPVERNNVTPDLRAIAERWRANLAPADVPAASVDDVARALFGGRTAVLDGPFRVFDGEGAARFSARFADDDRALEERYGARLAPVERAPDAPDAARLFSTTP